MHLIVRVVHSAHVSDKKIRGEASGICSRSKIKFFITNQHFVSMDAMETPNRLARSIGKMESPREQEKEERKASK